MAARRACSSVRESKPGAQHREFRQAALARAEEIAGTAHSQIGLGQDKTIGGRLHHLEPLFAHWRGVIGQEKAVRGAATATDPAPELVQLGQTEPVRGLDHHDRRIWYVDADLDHRSRDQDLELASFEAGHDPVLFGAGHPAMQQTDLEFGINVALQSFRLGDRRAHLGRVSESSTSGQITKACRPRFTSSRSNS